MSFNPPHLPERERPSPSRVTAWRHRRAQKRAAECSCTERGLPLLHTSTESKVGTEERYHYREHRLRHLAARPDYDIGWSRPSAETADLVYELLRDHLPALETIHPDPVTARQLIVVALDVAVTAGRYGHRAVDWHDDPRAYLRQVRQAVTRTTLTNAILRRWSDHARLAREQKRAYAVGQMTEETAVQCWRDLLVQDIDLPALWQLIVGAPTPLFRVRPSRFDVTRGRDMGTVTGYDISLHRGEALRAFERAVRRDRAYAPSRTAHTWRLWVVGRRRPLVDVHAPICAERTYNKVTIGDRTREVLKLQENARLMFDARLFAGEYRVTRAKLKQVKQELRQKFPKIGPPVGGEAPRRLRTTKVKLQAFLWEYRAVYEQAVKLQRRMYPGAPFVGVFPIRSAFYKVLNRRYQAAHFWLTQSSGRVDWYGRRFADIIAQYVPGASGDAQTTLNWFGSSRARWFGRAHSRADIDSARDLINRTGLLPGLLVSRDISASQTQIQAILLGDDGMEQDAILSRRPHKEALAERAWAAHEAERPLERIEADRAKALKIEARRYRMECLKVRTDLAENHEAALAVIAKHEALVETILTKLDPIASPYGPMLLGYENARDPHLTEMMKNLWMVLGYGETVVGILKKQAKDPERYGAGWRRVPTKRALKLGTDETRIDHAAVLSVLIAIPGFQTRQLFLDSCKDAVKRHPHWYDGLRLIDPLDGVEFEWNAPLKAAVPLRLNKWDLTLNKPGAYQPRGADGKLRPVKCPRCGRAARKRRGTRWFCTACNHVWEATFYEEPLDEQGRAGLDREKLRKMLAPCLIHMLDSLFASFVMQALAADGVKDFVSVHDCWWAPAIVFRPGREPESGHVVLDRAIRAAGRPWLLALGPVYEWMRQYIGSDQVERAFEKWKARVSRGLAGDETAWPYFYAP